ncbi:MAG: ChbG/HpnK family deacetylase [Acidobacteriaceae bacterium]|nr:ChbG/HpnK family deacetylase [Acidobacteriaceae bacterium]
MPARLILNSDDFGLTPGINRAVEELHRAGALTSATLMANGPAFEEAVAIAHRNPQLGIGCHVVLTDGVPVCHPHEIPSLLGADGKSFRASLVDFHGAVLRGRVKEDEIAREAHAQIAKIQRAGLDVTHLDTHKHTHILPGVARPLLHVAERCRIGAIRNPFEEQWSLKVSRSSAVRALEVRIMHLLRRRFVALPQIRSGAVATTDGTIGISATGQLDASTLNAMLQAMPAGTWELVCHPGYNDRDLDQVRTRLRASREIERQALLACFSHPENPPAPELIHYGALGPFARLRELRQFEPNSGHETFV